MGHEWKFRYNSRIDTGAKRTLVQHAIVIALNMTSIESDSDVSPARSGSPVESTSPQTGEPTPTPVLNDPSALIEREHLIELWREATDRFEQLSTVNAQLQRKLVDHFRQRKVYFRHNPVIYFNSKETKLPIKTKLAA